LGTDQAKEADMETPRPKVPPHIARMKPMPPHVIDTLTVAGWGSTRRDRAGRGEGLA
jgi:hypothetical protein